MKTATLRRFKVNLYNGQPIVALPPLEVKVDSLIFRAEQEAVYIAETQPAWFSNSCCHICADLDGVYVKAVTLRRVKNDLYNGRPIVVLPPLEVRVNSLVFTAEEEAIYMAFEAKTQVHFPYSALSCVVSSRWPSLDCRALLVLCHRDWKP